MTPVNYEILQCRSSGLLLLGDQLEAERLQLTGNNSGQGTNPDCLQPRESFCKHLGGNWETFQVRTSSVILRLGASLILVKRARTLNELDIYDDLATIKYNLKTMLPGSVLESVTTLAKSVNIDPLYVAMSLVTVFSSVISNSFSRPTPTQKEPLILFTAILGPKGTDKVCFIYCFIVFQSNNCI